MSPLFAQVHHGYWESARRDGWNDDERQLGIYLLTCPHRNLEGCYRLPLAYVADDLTWEPERVRRTLDSLTARDFAAYDEQARVVLIVNGLRFHCPKGPKQIAGALNALRAVPPTHLLRRLLESAEIHGPEFAAELRNAYPTSPDTPSKGYPQAADRDSAAGPTRPEAQPEAEAQPKEPLSPPDGAEAETSDAIPERPEVALLTGLLADLMLANDPGAKARPDTKAWRDPMRLLLDRDDRAPDLVERVIRWSQADNFWRSNILSPGKLREQFPQLVLKMQASNGNGATPNGADFSKYDRAAKAAA